MAPGPGQVIAAELVVTSGVDLLADVLGQSLPQEVLGGVLEVGGRQVAGSARGQVGLTEQTAPLGVLPGGQALLMLQVL